MDISNNNITNNGINELVGNIMSNTILYKIIINQLPDIQEGPNSNNITNSCIYRNMQLLSTYRANMMVQFSCYHRYLPALYTPVLVPTSVHNNHKLSSYKAILNVIPHISSNGILLYKELPMKTSFLYNRDVQEVCLYMVDMKVFAHWNELLTGYNTLVTEPGSHESNDLDGKSALTTPTQQDVPDTVADVAPNGKASEDTESKDVSLLLIKDKYIRVQWDFYSHGPWKDVCIPNYTYTIVMECKSDISQHEEHKVLYTNSINHSNSIHCHSKDDKDGVYTKDNNQWIRCNAILPLETCLNCYNQLIASQYSNTRYTVLLKVMMNADSHTTTIRNIHTVSANINHVTKVTSDNDISVLLQHNQVRGLEIRIVHPDVKKDHLLVRSQINNSNMSFQFNNIRHNLDINKIELPSGYNISACIQYYPPDNHGVEEMGSVEMSNKKYLLKVRFTLKLKCLLLKPPANMNDIGYDWSICICKPSQSQQLHVIESQDINLNTFVSSVHNHSIPSDKDYIEYISSTQSYDCNLPIDWLSYNDHIVLLTKVSTINEIYASNDYEIVSSQLYYQLFPLTMNHMNGNSISDISLLSDSLVYYANEMPLNVYHNLNIL